MTSVTVLIKGDKTNMDSTSSSSSSSSFFPSLHTVQFFIWEIQITYREGHQHGGRKPTETSVTEFCYQSINLSLEKLINIIKLYLLVRFPYNPIHFLCINVSTLLIHVLNYLWAKIWNCYLHNKCMGWYGNLTYFSNTRTVEKANPPPPPKKVIF